MEINISMSKLKTGDIILVQGKLWFFPLSLVTRFFTQGFRHIFLYYGCNDRKDGLVLESIGRCGPTISLLRKYAGQEIEVYTINHRYSEIFSEAILKAGDSITAKKYAFFDWLLIIPRSIAVKFGFFSGRIKSEYYPFYICSEFIQICFEDAPRYLDENTRSIYKRDVLCYLPKRLMFPSDFRDLPFLKFVMRGKIIL